MKHLYLILAAMTFAFTAQAAPKIKQIDTNKKRVAVKATSQTQMGTEWVATDKKGKQCTMEVIDKMAGVAILSAKNCSNLSSLKVGQALEKSLFSGGDSMQGQTSSAQNWNNVREQLKGLSVFGFYSMGSELPAKNDGQAGTYMSETAFGFGAEYEYGVGDQLIQGAPLAIVGGVSYEMSRDISKLKVNGQTTQEYRGDKPAIALWTPYANVQMDVTDRISGFTGLNYSIPMESNFGSDKAKSALGYQVGGSAKITSSLAVDGIYRWINLKTDAIEEISLDGFVIRGRYLF